MAPISTGTALTLTVGLSHQFHNKNTASAGQSANTNLSTTITKLAEHISSSEAICLTALRDDYRKKANFISSLLQNEDRAYQPERALKTIMIEELERETE